MSDDEPRSAQRYLEDLTPGGSDRLLTQACLTRNRLQDENKRLREQLRIAMDTLERIARCGCSACGPAPRDLAEARTLADDALICMSVVE